MTSRLSGHFSIFGLVFFVLKSLLGIAGQWSRKKKIAILTLKPRSCQNFNITNVGYSLRKHSFLLALRRRGRFARNVPSYEERGETDVFAGYVGYCGTRSMCSSSSVFIVRPPFPSFIPADVFQRREALTLRKFNGSCINLLF